MTPLSTRTLLVLGTAAVLAAAVAPGALAQSATPGPTGSPTADASAAPRGPVTEAPPATPVPGEPRFTG